jgi:hypothetical protein
MLFRAIACDDDDFDAEQQAIILLCIREITNYIIRVESSSNYQIVLVEGRD